MVGWPEDGTSVKLIFQEDNLHPPPLRAPHRAPLLSMLALRKVPAIANVPLQICSPEKRCYILDTADWAWLIMPNNLISQVLKKTCWVLNWMCL